MSHHSVSSKIILLNGRVVLPDRIEAGQALLLENGTITGLVDVAAVPPDAQAIDVEGRLICPGLVDIHTHGALNHIFNEATAEAFDIITRENARRGVTSLLATTMTAPIDELARCLQFTRNWMQQPHDGAQVLGIHVEGPYFAAAQAGAQDPANVRNPSDGTPAALLAHADVIKIFTYAPELPGALELTEQLHQLGIVAAAGHSNAKDSDVLATMERGLSPHHPHLERAKQHRARERTWRKPGLLEASLAFDDLTVEMISDNKHLPPTLMKLAYKAIGPDRLCAISDATNGAGLPEGSRYRMGNLEYEVCDGVGMMLDRSSFAGSTTLLNEMIPVLTGAVGIPLVEAVRMVSLTPARIIGAADRKGSLEPGKDADIAIFNDDFSAWRVMIGGHFIN